MRRAEVVALVSARRDEIVERFGVRSLSLFGSVARDEATPDSDVDVLVEIEGPTTFDRHMGLLISHRPGPRACRVMPSSTSRMSSRPAKPFFGGEPFGPPLHRPPDARSVSPR